MKQVKGRRVALGMMLLVALWLALWGDKTPPGAAAVRAAGTAIATSISPAARKDAPQAPAATLRIERVRAREALIADHSAGPAVDLFTARSWAPPPPPVAVTPAFELEAAPPLPFQVLGKKRESDRWEIYLARDGQTFIVHEGSSIDETYKVGRIAPPTLSIVYVPLGLTQTLDIGDFE